MKAVWVWSPCSEQAPKITLRMESQPVRAYTDDGSSSLFADFKLPSSDPQVLPVAKR